MKKNTITLIAALAAILAFNTINAVKLHKINHHLTNVMEERQ